MDSIVIGGDLSVAHGLRCHAPLRARYHGLSCGSRCGAERVAPRARTRRDARRYGRCIWSRRQRGSDRAGAPSVCARSRHRNQRRQRATRRSLGSRRAADASARGLRGELAAPKARTHRSLSEARARLEGPVRRIDWRAQGFARRRQDSPPRAFQRLGRTTRASAGDRPDRKRAESLQQRLARIGQPGRCVHARRARVLAVFPIDAGDLARASGTLRDVAERRGATTAQIALAWLLQRSPAVLPIPGTSSLTHLAENVAAAVIHLDEDDLQALAAERKRPRSNAAIFNVVGSAGLEPATPCVSCKCSTPELTALATWGTGGAYTP